MYVVLTIIADPASLLTSREDKCYGSREKKGRASDRSVELNCKTLGLWPVSFLSSLKKGLANQVNSDIIAASLRHGS